MRGSRKKLLCGKNLNASTRRAIKRQYKADIRAKAGWAEEPKAPHRPKLAGPGLKGAKPAPYGDAWSRRKHHPVSALGRPGVYGDLTERGRRGLDFLMFGKKDYLGYPIPGTGAASWLSKPDIEQRLANIASTAGIANYGRVW